MATETSELVIRLIIETKSAEQELKKTRTSFTELNQALELVKTGFSLVKKNFDAFVQSLQRGAEVDSLNRAFLNLVGGSEKAAQALEGLRGATQGLVSDTEILRQANQALTLGIQPEQFQQLTEAATALSISLGKDVTEGIESAVTAVARQSTLMLDNLGVTLKVSEAQDIYAEQLGKTTAELTEQEKQQAFSVVATQKLIAASEELGEVTLNAGQEFQALSADIQNVIDDILEAVVQDEALAEAFREVRVAISEIDWAAVAQGVATVTSALIQMAAVVTNVAAKAIDIFVNSLKNLNISLDTISIVMRGLSTGEIVSWGDAMDIASARARNIEENARRVNQILEMQRKAAAGAAEALGGGGSGGGGAPGAGGAGGGGGLAGGAKRADTALKDLMRTQERLARTFDFEGAGILGSVDDVEAIANIIDTEIAPSLEDTADVFTDSLEDGLSQVADSFGLDLGGAGDDFLSGLASGLSGLFSGQGFSLEGFDIGGLQSGALSTVIGTGLKVLSGDTGGITGQEGFQTAIREGFSLGGGIGATLTGGLSLFGGLGGLFGGGDPERLAREGFLGELREQLGDLDFNLLGSGGSGSIGADQFNVTGGGASGQATALTDAITNVLGLTGKLQEDFSGIFTNLITGFTESGEASENFNEVLANALSLMDELGITAEESKDILKEQFLDGELALNEFGVAVENLNILAQENLIGTGSISDALNILANNFDDPRGQLKALELLFGELQETGVTTVGEVGTALSDQLGPDAEAAFQALQDAGITSFENLEDRSADEIFLIINTLSQFEDELRASFQSGFGAAADAATSATSDIKRGVDSIVNSLDRVNRAADNAADSIKNLNNTRVTQPQDLNTDLGI